MTTSDVNLNNPDLANRFKKALEKLEQEKETMEKLKDRNILEIIFSNKTKDLARFGISMSEAISELHLVIDDMLLLIRDGKKSQVDIMTDLFQTIKEQSDINTDFRQKILDLAKCSVEDSLRIARLEDDVKEHGKRIVSFERIEKIKQDVEEAYLKKRSSSIARLCAVCRSLQKHLDSEVIFSESAKRGILTKIKQLEKDSDEVSESDLNARQSEISEYFKSFRDTRNKKNGIVSQFIFDNIPLDQGKKYTMHEIVSDIMDAISISESDRFVEYRNQLTGFIDDFLAQIDIDEQYLSDICATRKLLNESVFEIALIGEFQGGKSTTFNALCGGREISPRGLNGGGIKTSAVVVTAQNIDGNESKNGLSEWAEITWLDSDEIKRRIYDVLKQYDDNKLLKEQEKESTQNFNKVLQLAWKKDVQEEELDLLRIATLQCRLLESTKLKYFFQKTVVPVDQLQQIVTFPPDWEERWLKKSKADFKLEEILFAVVDHVLVRIHSEALARLGCRITDCPGLFVSKWDTDRAFQVMRKANAIWYLLSGEKQIGKEDKRALKAIKSCEYDDKCFFTLNRRKGNVENILKADQAILKTLGLDFDKIFTYDAFLAFRCAQVKNIDTLKDVDYECLVREKNKGQFDNSLFEDYVNDRKKCLKAMTGLIIKHMAMIDEDSLADQMTDMKDIGNNSNIYEKLSNCSGAPDVLNSIEKLIISTKASSILVRMGSKKCLEILRQYALRLKEEEDAKNISFEEQKRKEEKARTKLQDFISEWEENFSFLGNIRESHAEEQESEAAPCVIHPLDETLATDFFDSQKEKTIEDCTNSAIEICKEIWHKNSFWTSKDLNKEAEKKVSEEFATYLKCIIETYRKNVLSNSKFIEHIKNPFKNKLDNMRKAWEEVKKDNDLYNIIDVLSDDSTDEVNTQPFDKSMDSTIDLPWYFWEGIRDFFRMIASPFGIKIRTTDEKIEDFFKENNPVEDAFNKFLVDKHVREEIACCLGSQRRFYVENLEKSFRKMKDDLEKSITLHQNLLAKSDKDRKITSENARRKRHSIIEPYKNLIQAFENAVSLYYD